MACVGLTSLPQADWFCPWCLAANTDNYLTSWISVPPSARLEVQTVCWGRIHKMSFPGLIVYPGCELQGRSVCH